VNLKIDYQRTLVDYDVPQLFLASDRAGTNYVCLLVAQTEKYDEYATVAVSPGRLSDFLAGRLDLLTIISAPETEVRYVVHLLGEDMQGLHLHIVEAFPPEWLPDAGFYLADSAQIEEVTPVAAEAVTRNRAVLHLALSPPEARIVPKIDAYHLSTALGLFQSVVKFAYRKALASTSYSLRKALNSDTNYGLEVFAFSPGSFTVHMQSKVPADLLGFVDIERAFDTVDSLTTALESPQSALDVMKEHRGHLATSYRKLLQFVAENNVSISYNWATPHRPTPVQHRIPVARAAALYELSSHRRDLGVEAVSLTGSFVKANTRTGEWAIASDDGQEYRGYAGESSDVRLDGVVLGTTKYILDCEERLTGWGAGTEKSRLYLVRLRKHT